MHLSYFGSGSIERKGATFLGLTHRVEMFQCLATIAQANIILHCSLVPSIPFRMLVLRYFVVSYFGTFLIGIAAMGQNAGCTLTLTGSVIDEHDKEGLSFAEIYLPELSRGTVADENGQFRIDGLCAGKLLVRVMHLGCEPVERTISMTKSEVVQFKLEHHAHELKEFEVARNRPDENVAQARNVLDKADLEKSGGSLAEMLGRIPGVNVLSTGPTIGKPMIHGLSGNRILTLNQGIRQEDQQWGTEHAPNLDPFSSDRITVVKGAASVQYGSDAIGGVIITEPVSLPRTAGTSGDIRAVGQLNGVGGGGNATLQGGMKGLRGFGWRLQGSGKQLGDSRSPNYVLSNTGMNEQGLSGAIGYRNVRFNVGGYYSWFARELGILRASHIGNLTDLESSISTGKPWYVDDFTYAISSPRQKVHHHLAKAEVGYAVSDRGRVVLTYGFQTDKRTEFDIRRGNRSDLPALDLSLTSHTGEVVFNHWLGQKVHGKIGGSGLFQRNINQPGTGIRPLLPNYEKRSGGLFVIEHFPLSDKLELEAGARFEGTFIEVARYTLEGVYERPHHQYANHAFSAGANWTVKDSVRLRANISSAFRPPHVSELYSEGLHHGAAAIENGNRILGSERSLKATLDLEARWFQGKLRTDITLYMDRIKNYIYLRPSGTALTIRGAFPVFEYVATDAMIYGMDATLEYAFTPRWSFRSRSSMVRGRDLVRSEWLFQMPSDRTENSLVWSKQRAGKWNDMEFGLISTYVARQLRVPVNLDYMAPPGSYHLVGFQASASKTLGKHEVRFGLNAYNLLNTAYRDYLDRFRYYADARGLDLVIWLRFSFGKNNKDGTI